MNDDCLATPPFKLNAHGHVIDATGARVLACAEGSDCSLFSEREIDDHPHFICPQCGRFGQRMVEATAAQCGLSAIELRPEIEPPTIAADAATLHRLHHDAVRVVDAGEEAVANLRDACGGEPEGLAGTMFRQMSYATGNFREIRDSLRALWRAKAKIERERGGAVKGDT